MSHVIIVLYRVFIPWHLPGFLSPDVDVTAPNVRGLTTNQMQSSLTSPVRSRPAVLLVGPRRQEPAMGDIMINDFACILSTLRDLDIGRMELWIWRYG